MKKSLAIIVMAIAASPTLLLAHEGHGYTTGNSPIHYLAEPVHALALLVAVSAIAGVIYHVRKRTKKA